MSSFQSSGLAVIVLPGRLIHRSGDSLVNDIKRFTRAIYVSQSQFMFIDTTR